MQPYTVVPMFVKFECWWLRPFIITHFNIIISTRRDWFRRIGMRTRLAKSDPPLSCCCVGHWQFSLSLNEVDSLCAEWNEALLPSFQLFIKNELLTFLYFMRLFYVFIAGISLSFGTKHAFNIKNGFRCLWQFHWPQLITNIKTLLRL